MAMPRQNMDEEQQQTTIPESQLERKRRKNLGGRTRKLALSPSQVEQCEKLAAIGLTDQQIAWIIGVSESTLERRMREDKERHYRTKKGFQPSGGNVYEAIQRGRAQGNSIIAKTAFELATKERNVSMIIFLAKTRLKWAEAAQEHNVNLKRTVVFETQIGQDGVVRQQQKYMDEDGNETNVVPINRAKDAV